MRLRVWRALIGRRPCDQRDPHLSGAWVSETPTSPHLVAAGPAAHALSALMSVSRTRFILGLQPRLVLATRAGPALAARRLISSSSCTGAQHQHHHHREPLETLTSKIDERHTPSAPPDPDAQLAAYRDGPSALDKAVHLFFFTEIIRGNYPAALSLPPRAAPAS